MNIKTDFILEHLNLKNEGLLKELAVLVLKPDCAQGEIGQLMSFASENGLKLLSTRQLKLSASEVVALYPETFSYSDNDLVFGIGWKEETLRYMTSGQSICYLFTGENAIAELARFKYSLREKYGKVTRPDSPMSPEDFKNKVIRNLVHVADNNETQSAIWILFS